MLKELRDRMNQCTCLTEYVSCWLVFSCNIIFIIGTFAFFGLIAYAIYTVHYGYFALGGVIVIWLSVPFWVSYFRKDKKPPV